MLSKEILGVVSSVLTVISSSSYFVAVLRGKIKPHVFSWLLWVLLTAITFFAQYAAHAGAGAWNMGINSVLCFCIVLLTLKRGDTQVKRQDIVMFVCALSAVPLWYLTDNPLTAMVVAILVEGFAYIMTFKKAYVRPHEEATLTFSIDIVRLVISGFAMESYSLTTMLYPVVINIFNIALVGMIFYRRRLIMVNNIKHSEKA